MHKGLSQSQHHRATRLIAGSKAWRKTNGGSGPESQDIQDADQQFDEELPAHNL